MLDKLITYNDHVVIMNKEVDMDNENLLWVRTARPRWSIICVLHLMHCKNNKLIINNKIN